MEHARAYFDQLNRAYNVVHKAKEDLFWSTYMAISDDHAGFTRAENAYKDFISDPAKAAGDARTIWRTCSGLPASAERDALLHGLNGWLALFEANTIDSDEGRALMRAIIDAEAALFARKRELQPRHLNEQRRVRGRLAQHAGDQSGHQPGGRAPPQLVRGLPRDRALGARTTASSIW